jgi:hypothetical protein
MQALLNINLLGALLDSLRFEQQRWLLHHT